MRTVDLAGKGSFSLFFAGLSNVLVLLAGQTAALAQDVGLDFDATGPTTTADIDMFFDILGTDKASWMVEPNAQNAANMTNALHTTSDGGQLENWFSRVAILKPTVFQGEDVIASVELTWDDMGGDANDHAGVYVRFNGTSDVPLENSFYFVRIDAGGNSSSIHLHRVKDGAHQELFSVGNSPFVVREGDTVTVMVRAEGDAISVSLNGQPVPGLSPFIDPDPLLGPGAIGVGQNTNPLYVDNLEARFVRGITIAGADWERTSAIGGEAGARLPEVVTTEDGQVSFHMAAPNENKFGLYVVDVTQLPAGETRFPVRLLTRQVGDGINGLGIRNLTIDPDDPASDPSMQVQTSFVAILTSADPGTPPRARDDLSIDTDIDPPGTIGMSGADVGNNPAASTLENPPGEIATMNATLELMEGINVLRLDPTDPRDLPEYAPDAGYQIFELTIGPDEPDLKGTVLQACDVTRELSRRTFFPGDEVTVTLRAENLFGKTTITETLPEGVTVLDPGGGTLEGDTLTFVAAADGEFSYTVAAPEECSTVVFTGQASGELCRPSTGENPLICGIQPTGAVSGMLQIGPVDPGRNTGADDCTDGGRLGTTDYLINADGSLGESNLLVSLGDEVAPDFGGNADAVGVKPAADTSAINPRAGEGILTVWFADAGEGGRINFNDPDNIGNPVDDYIIYSAVYLDNTTGGCLDAVLEVGSDDAVKVLLNGEVVRVIAECRGVPGLGGGDMVPVLLAPGKNVALTAVVESGGGTDVRLVVRKPDGSPFTDGSIAASFAPPATIPQVPSARVTRTIPPDVVRPGDTVTVTLDAANVAAETTVTESLPPGYTVVDAGGGMVIPPDLVTLDFDTSGPTSDAEIETFFDLRGQDGAVVQDRANPDDNGWRIDPNPINPANGTNALHTPSNGGALDDFFSRVAVLKPELFAARDVNVSVGVSWDDNDEAGVYARFTGNSDDPLGNEYYYALVKADAGDQNVELHRVKGGAAELLATGHADVNQGDSATLTLRAVGNELSVFVDGQPIAGLNPVVDTDPLLAAGAVGVGQFSNPVYFDDLTAEVVAGASLSLVATADSSLSYVLEAPASGPERAEVSGLVTSTDAEGCGVVEGDTSILFFPCTPDPDAPDAELIEAFSFNARDISCPTFNDPTLDYTLVFHGSGSLAPADPDPATRDPSDLRYYADRGFGYVSNFPSSADDPGTPYGDRSGYEVFGPFDDSPNDRNEFPGGDCPEEIYDSFIGAKNFLTDCNASVTGGDPDAPCTNDTEGIVFRIDVPNGLYRFVGAFGDPDNPHAHRIVVENGGSGTMIGEHVVLVDNFNQAAQTSGETERPCEGVFARVGFDGKVPPFGDGVPPDPRFVNFDESGLPTSDCPESPELAVTEGFIRLHQLQGNSNDGPFCGADVNGGDTVVFEAWRTGDLPCPAEGDTNCTGLDVVGPAGGVAGEHAVTATATDDSGDDIIFTFTVDDGAGTTLTAGPQAEATATFDLGVGEWTITVTVDDDPVCPDETAEATCTEVITVLEGGLQVPGDMDGRQDIQITDVIRLLNILFVDRTLELPCEGGLQEGGNLAMADWNGDGSVNIADGVGMIIWRFVRTVPETAHFLGSDCQPIPGCPDSSDSCVP